MHPRNSHTRRLDPELLPQDFDPEYGVGPMDGAALEDDLFGDLIGCADIKLQLTRIRSTFVHSQRLGRDPLEVRACFSALASALSLVAAVGTLFILGTPVGLANNSYGCCSPDVRTYPAGQTTYPYTYKNVQKLDTDNNQGRRTPAPRYKHSGHIAPSVTLPRYPRNLRVQNIHAIKWPSPLALARSSTPRRPST